MATLKFWQEMALDVDNMDKDGNCDEILQWFCSDGISTFFGKTKAEAAAHFGVPVGNFDEISKAASVLGKKGGSVTSERKAAAVRANGLKGGRPKGSGELTPLQREALELRQSGLKIREIAARMGRQPENIRQLLGRAEYKTRKG